MPAPSGTPSDTGSECSETPATPPPRQTPRRLFNRASSPVPSTTASASASQLQREVLLGEAYKKLAASAPDEWDKQSAAINERIRIAVKDHPSLANGFRDDYMELMLAVHRKCKEADTQAAQTYTYILESFDGVIAQESNDTTNQ